MRPVGGCHHCIDKSHSPATDQSDNQSPAFSPDGRALAFVAMRESQLHKVHLMALKYPDADEASGTGRN